MPSMVGMDVFGTTDFDMKCCFIHLKILFTAFVIEDSIPLISLNSICDVCELATQFNWPQTLAL